MTDPASGSGCPGRTAIRCRRSTSYRFHRAELSLAGGIRRLRARDDRLAAFAGVDWHRAFGWLRERTGTAPLHRGHPGQAAGGRPDKREPVFEALLAALRATTDERATLYHDLVLSALPVAARHHLDALMSTGLREYRSDFVRKNVNQGRAEGRAESKIEAVLAVLAARGISVPDEARARITGCDDLDQLDIWIRRAATAGSLSDLFTQSA